LCSPTPSPKNKGKAKAIEISGCSSLCFSYLVDDESLPDLSQILFDLKSCGSLSTEPGPSIYKPVSILESSFDDVKISDISTSDMKTLFLL